MRLIEKIKKLMKGIRIRKARIKTKDKIKFV